MDEVLIVAIVFGSLVALAAMIVNAVMRVKGAQGSAGASGGEAMSVRELEQRIRQAVEEANEPLRLQIQSLQSSLEAAKEPKQRKLEGGALHDPGLLAEGREHRSERGADPA